MTIKHNKNQLEIVDRDSKAKKGRNKQPNVRLRGGNCLEGEAGSSIGTYLWIPD